MGSQRSMSKWCNTRKWRRKSVSPVQTSNCAVFDWCVSSQPFLNDVFVLVLNPIDPAWPLLRYIMVLGSNSSCLLTAVEVYYAAQTA